MKRLLEWVVYIIFFSILAVTARYFFDIAESGQKFDAKKWCSIVLIGTVLSVICGLICKHFGLSEEITYALVGLVAISSREIIAVIPDIVAKLMTLRIK